tara:strand:- start:2924 stop:3328 length:405 start_codon:yes stop_codon:yes gene_type:complete
MKTSKNFSEIERSSNKSFGVVFAFVFLIIALYPIINSEKVNIWGLIIAAIFFTLGFFRPQYLSFLNLIWHKFGLLLGGIVSPIVMFILYFLTVVPTGLIMKLLGNDLLNQKLNKKTNSYWVERDKPMGSMKNQF